MIGDWYFVAVRYDQAAGTVKRDVNGSAFSGTTAFSGTFGVTGVGRNPCCDSPYGGLIDTVFFYDAVLSDQEIADIRTNGFTAAPEPPMATLTLIGIVIVVLLRIAGVPQSKPID